MCDKCEEKIEKIKSFFVGDVERPILSNAMRALWKVQGKCENKPKAPDDLTESWRKRIKARGLVMDKATEETVLAIMQGIYDDGVKEG